MQVAKILIVISSCAIMLGIFLLSDVIKKTNQSQPSAEAPFVGCVGGGEWLCICPYNGDYFHECSIIEDTEGKQKYIDKCAGDRDKGFLQWKWDTALQGTGDGNCCGGQNLCGSLILTRPPRTQNQQQESQQTSSQIDLNDMFKNFRPTASPDRTDSRPLVNDNQNSTIVQPTVPRPTDSFPVKIFEFPTSPPNNRNSHSESINSPPSFMERSFYQIKLYDSLLENYFNNMIYSVFRSSH